METDSKNRIRDEVFSQTTYKSSSINASSRSKIMKELEKAGLLFDAKTAFRIEAAIDKEILMRKRGYHFEDKRICYRQFDIGEGPIQQVSE